MLRRWAVGAAALPRRAASTAVPVSPDACPTSSLSFAEGSTRAGIETLLTVFDASDGDASVEAEFSSEDGSHRHATYVWGAHSRANPT